MEETLKVVLRTAVTRLQESGFRYALIGGLALAEWGVARYTHDVDIKVLVPDVDYASVRGALRTAFPKRAREHVPENPLIVAVYIEGVIVDFLLALPGYEELIVERAVQRDLGGWSVWICTAEDLIIQKVVANRGKDWLDVEALLIEQHGRLDEPYIEGWLTQFAEVLEAPQLLTQYQQLIESVSRLGD